MSKKVTFIFDENKFHTYCREKGLDEKQISQFHTMLFPADAPMTEEIRQALQRQNTNKK